MFDDPQQEFQDAWARVVAVSEDSETGVDELSDALSDLVAVVGLLAAMKVRREGDRIRYRMDLSGYTAEKIADVMDTELGWMFGELR